MLLYLWVCLAATGFRALVMAPSPVAILALIVRRMGVSWAMLSMTVLVTLHRLAAVTVTRGLLYGVMCVPLVVRQVIRM